MELLLLSKGCPNLRVALCSMLLERSLEWSGATMEQS